MNKTSYNILYRAYSALTDPHDKRIMGNIIVIMEKYSTERKDASSWGVTLDRIDHLSEYSIFGQISTKEIESPQGVENDSHKDYRIKDVTFNGFRTFPQNEKPFGFSILDKDGKISSGFFIAANGVGKSTIFSGLQYVYTGSISNETYDSLDVNDKNRYKEFGLSKIANKTINPSVEVETSNDTLNNISDEAGGALTPFFISDYDVNLLQRQDLSDFVSYQLGIQDIERLLNSLKNIIQDIEERTTKDKGVLNKEELTSIAAYTITHTNYKSFTQPLCKDNITKDDIKDFWLSKKCKDLLPQLRTNYYQIQERQKSKDIADPSIGNISAATTYDNSIEKKLDQAFKYISEWIQSFHRYELTDAGEPLAKVFKDMLQEINNAPEKSYQTTADNTDRKNTLESIVTLLGTELLNVKKKVVEDYNTFLVNTLKMFSDGDEDISFSYDENTGNIKSEVNIRSDEYEFSVSPRLYYNTFRFKLYAVAIKIALSFQIMKDYNISAPIVIDDVFSASDFDNSIRLSEFVMKTYDTYAYMFKDWEPLQIILLTHDDGIQHTFAKYAEGPCIAKRIFSYKDVIDDNDSIDKDGKFINLCF